MKEKSGDDLPYELGISYQDFIDYKDEWILWRTLGHYSENGIWIAPVSFNEAQQLPKRKLDAFFSLDGIIEIMKKQNLKKKPKRANG